MAPVPVLMAGGPGTRLWPLSRRLHPKPFVPLLGSRSPFQWALEVLSEPPLVVCGGEHRFLALEQAEACGLPPRALVLEPFPRGTAPAATAVSLLLQAWGEDRPMVLLSTDGWFESPEALRRALEVAEGLARQGYLVLCGVPPSRPETRFGYIRLGTPLDGSGPAWTVHSFVEKPEPGKVQALLQGGGVLWNAGIFVVRPSLWLDLLSLCRPDMAEWVERAFREARQEGPFLWLEESAFARCPTDSIDYAVLERATRPDFSGPSGFRGLAVVPVEGGWSDLGLWPAVWAFLPRDGAGNASQGRVVLHHCRNSLVVAHSRLVAVVGLQDATVVETPDAVLVASHEEAPRVKEVVGHLAQEGWPEEALPWRVHRPWGWYQVVDRGEQFQVKRLLVKPGASLSLQYHRHRAEHWVVVRGTAQVTRGEEVFLLHANQSTYIPREMPHRLQNPGPEPLEVVEVQTGSYLGEDDIVRLEDRYGRAPGAQGK